DGLNPAHVPCWWMNNPTLGLCCEAMIGRADIEESKSNVAMNAWLPQASYPCGNFSDTSSLKFLKTQGSIGHAFTVCIHTENQLLDGEEHTVISQRNNRLQNRLQHTQLPKLCTEL